MPEEFENCVKQGGKVRTVTGPNAMFNLKKGEYRHICFIDGKMFLGEKKRRKKNV